MAADPQQLCKLLKAKLEEDFPGKYKISVNTIKDLSESDKLVIRTAHAHPAHTDMGTEVGFGLWVQKKGFLKSWHVGVAVYEEGKKAGIVVRKKDDEVVVAIRSFLQEHSIEFEVENV